MLGVCVPRAQVKGINLSSVRITELQKVQRIVRLIQETLYNHGGHFMRCEPPTSVGKFEGSGSVLRRLPNEESLISRALTRHRFPD